MLDLAGGSGEKPQEAKAPKASPAFVFDPSPEEVAAMSDDRLLDLYGAMVEYDASGGKALRKLRREMRRRTNASRDRV